MLFVKCLTVVSWAACSLARTLKARQDGSFTDPQYVCGDIVTAVNEGYQVFLASDAYACLTSVPFNPAVATRFIRYFNETIQFQSTLAYLKNPPEGYQQPAVDVLAELNRIQDGISANTYANQYEFETDVQLLTYAMRDSHVSLNAGILSAFSFASPYEVASVSLDGKEEPRIYITDDIIDYMAGGKEPSPISTINGTEVNQFLTQYADLNAWGYVERHAEWNALMSHPTLDIQGGLTTLSGGGSFYPGDNLTFTFENNSYIETVWVAIYTGHPNSTGPLATGGDFYNYHVLGLLPESYDDSLLDIPIISDGDDDTESPIMTNWTEASYGAFPDTNISQFDLGVFGGGVVTGYLYEDISTGVLSLPTFDIIPQTTGNYSQAVSDFIADASAAGLNRVIIDLQRNSGGTILLAFTTFKSFFPDLTPFSGSRRRSFPLANVIGTATSEYWAGLNETDSDLQAELSANEWVIQTRLNAATGRNFSGWPEYQGPVVANGDAFTLTERYDLANQNFDEAAFDQWTPMMYLANATLRDDMQRQWNPDQIVILTDGLCASACALFVEMMTRAGVRTVVAGGRPNSGPMQAAAGTRGAVTYTADTLDDAMSYARSIDTYVDENANATIPDVREPGMYYNYFSVNLRDQVRANETTPLQFKFEAADCRIYYTMANLYNMTRLWHDVSAAAFDDMSLCVQGSTGFSTTNNTSPSPPPAPQAQHPILTLGPSNPNPSPALEQSEWDDNPNDGLRGPKSRGTSSTQFHLCTPDGRCPDLTTTCRPIRIYCSSQGDKEVKACLPRCVSWANSPSCPGGTCLPQVSKDAKIRNSKAVYTENLSAGLCYPHYGTRSLGCRLDPPPQA
ncbi:hypothetical protein BDW02DRAFT_565981 [Decorospora gaudefroyi]|uniref:Uncharacterized protein n=1 Tax=Decorospora gaudefroyi TaxID=184978 RepID=A0A6A5KK46_9PLEO|nr:hypothetical protein BDW02DRAFT_565981 [Decorospora gaudefroyi]